ncbi:MAG: hypothetical protein RR461_00930 [Angelakisella sp.]
MKKGTVISIFALLISIVGLMIALIAYFKRRNCVLCDDLEDDMVEFYEDDDCTDDCCCCCEETEETDVPDDKTEA